MSTTIKSVKLIKKRNAILSSEISNSEKYNILNIITVCLFFGDFNDNINISRYTTLFANYKISFYNEDDFILSSKI